MEKNYLANCTIGSLLCHGLRLYDWSVGNPSEFQIQIVVH